MSCCHLSLSSSHLIHIWPHVHLMDPFACQIVATVWATGTLSSLTGQWLRPDNNVTGVQIQSRSWPPSFSGLRALSVAEPIKIAVRIHEVLSLLDRFAVKKVYLMVPNKWFLLSVLSCSEGRWFLPHSRSEMVTLLPKIIAFACKDISCYSCCCNHRSNSHQWICTMHISMFILLRTQMPSEACLPRIGISVSYTLATL